MNFSIREFFILTFEKCSLKINQVHDFAFHLGSWKSVCLMPLPTLSKSIAKIAKYRNKKSSALTVDEN